MPEHFKETRCWNELETRSQKIKRLGETRNTQSPIRRWKINSIHNDRERRGSNISFCVCVCVCSVRTSIVESILCHRESGLRRRENGRGWLWLLGLSCSRSSPVSIRFLSILGSILFGAETIYLLKGTARGVIELNAWRARWEYPALKGGSRVEASQWAAGWRLIDAKEKKLRLSATCCSDFCWNLVAYSSIWYKGQCFFFSAIFHVLFACWMQHNDDSENGSLFGGWMRFVPIPSLVGTSATFDPVVPSLCSFFLLHPIDPCVPPTSARLLLASLSADVSFIPFALPWLLQPNLSDRFFLPLVSSAFFSSCPLVPLSWSIFVCVCVHLPYLF